MRFTFGRLLATLLRNVHAGESHLAWHAKALSRLPDTILVTSPAFAHGQPLPPQTAAPPHGNNVSPALAMRGAPAGTAELVLIIQDPDAPFPRPVLHALVTGIPPSWTSLAEGVISRPDPAPFQRGSVFHGALGYTGPNPPPGHGAHRYIIQVFASDAKLSFDGAPTLAAVLKALSRHATARGHITGTYEVP